MLSWSGCGLILPLASQRARSGWYPIGIGLRRTTSSNDAVPFPTWSVTEPWMPAGSAIEMLTPGDDKSSPSLFVAPRALADTSEQAARASRYHDPIGVHRMTAVRLVSPGTHQPIGRLTYLQRLGVLDPGQGREWMAELTFDSGETKKSKDLQPDLPIVIRL
jgi:hypothetical protein